MCESGFQQDGAAREAGKTVANNIHVTCFFHTIPSGITQAENIS